MDIHPPSGFFSIVQKPHDASDRLTIRGRVRGGDTSACGDDAGAVVAVRAAHAVAAAAGADGGCRA